MSVCVICEGGWILKGKETYDTDNNELVLKDAAVVRRWSNGKGIGGIAKAENADEYTTDYIGDVAVRQSKVIFTFACEW